jgi:hypothetical protein
VNGIPEVGDFSAWWHSVRHPGASQPLEAHLRDVHQDLVRSRLDLARLKRSLEELLAYLSGDGRTEDNCRSTDAFFCLLTAEHPRLVDRLPAGAWQDVVDDLGIDLGASLSEPETAERAGTSPERMLDRIRSLDPGHRSR